jgi:putative addiction module component (TIGR02574 family)
LIEDLWDRMADDEAAASELPLSDGERAMFDERLREYQEAPEAGRPWAEIRSES